MKKHLSVLLAALLAMGLVAGCSGKAATTAGSVASAASSAVAGGTTGTTGTDASTSCPTDNTKAFPKARFVVDVGLAVGTFHRYIWKPYQEGKFTKGADGRVLAIAKAVGVAALDLKLLKNAKENVQADPTLCKVLAAPLGQAIDALDGLKGKITSGDLGSLAAIEGVLGGLLTSAKSNGIDVKEITDEAQAAQG